MDIQSKSPENHVRKSGIDPKYIYWFILLLIIFGRIWLITGIPMKYNYGPHDDSYFVNSAYHILSGDWFGSYDEYTLIKVPFYSFFLAFSFLTGLPLFFIENIFYICACLLLAYSIKPILKNHWWRLIFFCGIVFSPISLASNWAIRIYREFVYDSLTIYVIAFSIGLFLRRDRKILELTFWAIGLGLSMGAFMLTREEGVWIYPVLFVLLLISCLAIVKNKTSKKWLRVGIIFMPIIIWYIPTFVVSYINYSYYGFWGTTEQLDPDIMRITNTLGRIKTNDWYPHVRVTHEALNKAYEVSPLLAELKDTFEKYMVMWEPHSEAAFRMKPSWYQDLYSDNGNEIGAGHFIWAFRDTLSVEGYFSNGKYPREFIKGIADQLEAACANGALECTTSQNIPFIGSINQKHIPIIFHFILHDGKSLLNYDYVGIETFPLEEWLPISQLYSDEFKYYDYLSYNSLNEQTLVVSKTNMEMSGWGLSEDGSTLEFSSLDQLGQTVGDKFSNNILSPDVEAYFQSKGQNITSANQCRFQISIPPDASQIVIASSSSTITIPINQLTSKYSISQDGITITIDNITPSSTNVSGDIRVSIIKLKSTIMDNILQLYRKSTIPAIFVSFVMFVVIIVSAIKNKSFNILNTIIVLVYLFGLLVSRFLTLVIVDATTTASGIIYGDSIYLFLYSFIFIASIVGVQLLFTKKNSMA